MICYLNSHCAHTYPSCRSAPGNSEIIVNSVVILFVLELDENCYCTLSSFAPDQAKSWAWEDKGESNSDSLGGCKACSPPPFRVNPAELEGEVARLRKEVKALRENINLLLEDPKDNLLIHRSDHAD